MTSEYFRGGNRRVWHIAPAFSHLPLPARNAGKALCGLRVSHRLVSQLEAPRAQDICRKCAEHVAEQVRYDREAQASGQGWRDEWRSYANCGGNDFDRGWNCQQSDTESAPTQPAKLPTSA